MFQPSEGIGIPRYQLGSVDSSGMSIAVSTPPPRHFGIKPILAENHSNVDDLERHIEVEEGLDMFVATMRRVLESLGRTDIIDVGDIATARAVEMLLPICGTRRTASLFAFTIVY